MKEKIRKKTKRPQTEDMIFTEEDFEDVSEETKGNSPKHRKRSRRTSGGFPARKAGIIAGGVIGVLVLLYLGISVFFMSHFYIIQRSTEKIFREDRHHLWRHISKSR